MTSESDILTSDCASNDTYMYTLTGLEQPQDKSRQVFVESVLFVFLSQINHFIVVVGGVINVVVLVVMVAWIGVKVVKW